MSRLYGGRVLHIDLTSRRWHSHTTGRFEEELGGRGLAARLLFESRATRLAGAHETVLCMAPGSLTGSCYPGCPRTHVSWVSPAPGSLGHAAIDGAWGAELKQAGWDAVVLEGRADRPVWVCVRNEAVEISDATELWGASFREAQDRMRAALESPEARVAGIGPAGERHASLAVLQHDLGWASGDAGSGAVMGWQRCKAVVVRGTRGVRPADPDRFASVSLAAHRMLCSSRLRAEARTGVRGEAPGGWESAKLSCTGCPVACLRALRRRGRPGTVLSHALLTGLWPELRRRDAASWCEFVLQCADEGVDAGLVAAVLNGSQGPAGRGALTGRAPWNGDGASLRRLISGTASAGVAGATRSMSAGEGEVPEVLAAAGAASRRAAAPAELAQVVGELVGACAQIAGEADAQVRLDGYAQALVAGRGRAASVDGLLRAAGRAVRLERVLAWNVSAAAPLRAVPLSDGAEQGNVAGCGAVVEAGRAH